MVIIEDMYYICVVNEIKALNICIVNSFNGKYMSKEKYTRDNFRSSLLKQIIIRVDYSSLTDLNGFIMKLKSLHLIKDTFSGYRLIKTNNINFQIDSKVFEERYIPLEVNETGNIHRFFDCKIEPIQNTFMDISPTFICITIQCNENYKIIDPYLDFITNVVVTLREYDSYVTLERLAIRKIDGNDYDNIKEVYNIFEEIVGFENVMDDEQSPLKKSYTDSFISKAANIKVNLTRSLERFSNGKIRYVLDIDGYVDSSLMSPDEIKSKEDVKYLLKNRINNELFELFKTNVTEYFLSKGVIA